MNLIDYGRKKWSYLLKADFGGADSGSIADATSVESVSSGSVQAGTLIVDDDGTGSVAVLSNKLRFDPNSAASWLIGAYSSEALTRSRGLAFKFKFQQITSASSNLGIGFVPTQTPLSTSPDAGVYCSGSSTDLISIVMSGTNIPIDDHTTDEKSFCIVLGGYSSALPWDGAASGYSDGSAYFQHDGTNWILKYRKVEDVGTPLYFGCRVSQLNPIDLDDLAIPDADLSSLLQPLVLDTFTDTNGTALTAHTPDVDVVGGGWNTASEGSDIIEIQSNMARGNGTTNRVFSTVDCGKSDVFIEISGDAPLSGGGGVGMIIFRFQDINNLWQFDCFNNLASLRDRVAGTFTTRSSSTCTNGTPLRYTLTANGQNIKGYLSDVEEVSFSSANFETATRHGIRSDAQGDVDYIAIYPIGTNGEYSDLDRY